jgi:NADH:ubiquinone oxidoreductase subunit
MANLWTRLFTAAYGKSVATDSFGNRYYHERREPKGRRRRRWVIYKGEVEASRVPPEWHAWLHYTLDEAPLAGGVPHADWQKPHAPNPTGSDAAYRPPGHLLAGGRRDKATGDYEPWQPN